MKRYTMATVTEPCLFKQQLKYMEIPLRKFSDEVIPHHQKVYEDHKVQVHKLSAMDNETKLKRVINERKHSIKQLRDLMYELDTLRTQVMNEDLDKFDMQTLSLRKIIISMINGYNEMEKAAERVNQSREKDVLQHTCRAKAQLDEGTPHLQIQDTCIEDLKIKAHEAQLRRVEAINKDVEDLHEMYQDLHNMVGSQAENVDHIEVTTESTKENVEQGNRNIMKALKFQAVAYPVTGAFLGGMLGGPIGLLAGLKVGGLAALGCAVAGYSGGKWVGSIRTKAVGNQAGEASEIHSDSEVQTNAKIDVHSGVQTDHHIASKTSENEVTTETEINYVDLDTKSQKLHI